MRRDKEDFLKKLDHEVGKKTENQNERKDDEETPPTKFQTTQHFQIISAPFWSPLSRPKAREGGSRIE